jgi:DNA-binding FadR family transcriptional regulator
MNSDEERINWEIDTVRRAISIDLARLASKKLTPEKREIIREHLAMNIDALRDLVKRKQSASPNLNLEADQLSFRFA